MSEPNKDNDIAKILDFEGRMTRVEVTNEHIVEALNEIKNEMREGFSSTRTEILSLRTETNSDFKWLLRTMLGVGGILIGIMAHGFHWF